MLKEHPKGLLVAFFTNMGERFGFYTMMAILALFLQAKYGLSVLKAGNIYSWFYFSIYATALFGGMFADWQKKYKSVILIGQIMMIAGYVMMTIPSVSLPVSLIALLVIALGNGFFKGNLQAVVGQLYEDEKYAKYRDTAYIFFYVGVNVGAFFAPFAAVYIRNWWLNLHGFAYDANLPMLCNQFLNGNLANIDQLQALAEKVTIHKTGAIDLAAFAQQYKNVFFTGYHWAFAVAASGMIISLLIYVIFNKTLPNKSIQAPVDKYANTIVSKPKSNKKPLPVSLLLMTAVIGLVLLIPGLDFNTKFGLGLALGLFAAFVSYIYLLSTVEERPKVISLIFIFVVVIFFWMSFNQNGLVLTQFATEYVQKDMNSFTYLFFDFKYIICLLAVVGGLVLLFQSKSTLRRRVVGGGLIILFGTVIYYFVYNTESVKTIAPEIFQSFNPLFIILLMPVIMWLFQFLRKRGAEPSTPRKIALGLFIAGLSFVLLLVASLHLSSPHLLNGRVIEKSLQVSPYWLMGSYFILTLAEIFLSPMGMSFVSKVAPKRFEGIMQGGWLLTTAVGNKLLIVGSMLWGKVSLSVLWGVFAACCFLSAIIILSMIRPLERITKNS